MKVKTKPGELLEVFAVLLTAGVLATCSSTNPTKHTGSGPSAPSGATMIPGGPMEPTPIAPSPKIPKS
ncbi:putative lipoprotein [Mycobacterium avium MAV_120809_2495]|nr:putative lipoprotein [Mycobacterium avium MAV_120809_2495]